MSKTPLFRKLKRALRQAHNANQADLPSPGRRCFIKHAAIAGVGTYAASHLAWMDEALAASKKHSGPIAILGGGASGLAAAYRLSLAKIPFVLFEAQARVGGRVFTARDYNADGQFVEIGGELVDTGHFVLRALAKQLLGNGSIEDFKPADGTLDSEIMFFGGRTFSHHEFIQALRPVLINLNAALDEMWAGGDRENNEISYRSDLTKLVNLKKYDNLSLRDFLRSEQMLSGVAEADQWVLQWLEVAYVCEYGMDAAQQSAISLLYLVGTEISDQEDFSPFGESDEVSRVKGGSDTLVKALLQYFQARGQSDCIRLKTKLTKIEMVSDKFSLTFADGSKATYGQVICTLPFSVLSQNEQGFLDLPLSPLKKSAIQTLAMGTNSKTYLTFSDRLWRQTGGTFPANRGSLYGDFVSQSFWESSRDQAGARGILTNYTGGATGLGADETTFTQALSDLDRVYPGISNKFEPRIGDIDESLPGRKQTINWSKNPYTKGSYAAFGVGQWTGILGSPGEPELNGRLFFAGEHTSTLWQGYMEGAYESGMRAAEELIATRTSGKVKDRYDWAKEILEP